MNIIISCSPKIENKHWIETQLIDYLYDSDDINQIWMVKNELGGNKILRDYLTQRHYNINYFAEDFREFGIACISNANLAIMEKVNFLFGMFDGKSRCLKHQIEIALRKKIPMNIRYFDEKKSLCAA